MSTSPSETDRDVGTSRICHCGEHAWVPVRHGAVLVDPKHEAFLKFRTWHSASNHGTGYYARSQMSVRTSSGIKKVCRLMHTLLVWAPAGHVIDHANGNGLDNRLSNLRAATPGENSRNRTVAAGAKAGYRGVRVQRGRYIANISIDTRDTHIGSFATAEEAARAYDAAAFSKQGEFARLNFPLEISGGDQ